MRMDWIFSGENWTCGVRAAGVLIRNDKILLQREENGHEYAVPGGHIHIGETLEDGLKREWLEEMGTAICCQRLLWTEECFWEWKGKKNHSLSFYYRIETEKPDDLPDDGLTHCHKDNSHIVLEWVELDALKDIVVYPEFLKEAIFRLDEPMQHFVTSA